MTQIQEIQFRQICQTCSGIGQIVTTKWEKYIGNVYVISRCDICKGSGREKMTNEQTLVKVFTEVFKTLGELQRVANDLEAYLEEKNV